MPRAQAHVSSGDAGCLGGLHVIPVDPAECHLAEEQQGGAEFLTVVLLGVGSNVAGADGARRGSDRSQL